MAEATRVTGGREEFRNILRSGQIRSAGHSGYTFFREGGLPSEKYLPTPRGELKIGPYSGWNQGVGYVFRTESEKLATPNPSVMERGTIAGRNIGESVEYYKSHGYKTLPPATPSKELSTFQRVIQNPETGDWVFKPERSFERFQQKYEGISAASKSRSAMEMGKDLRPAARTLGNALGGFGRAVGRLAGPVGVAMTAYDLAQAFPAPTPISEEDMGQALREYRTGPQPRY